MSNFNGLLTGDGGRLGVGVGRFGEGGSAGVGVPSQPHRVNARFGRERSAESESYLGGSVYQPSALLLGHSGPLEWYELARL